MADFSIIQGESRSFDIDATNFGTIDAFKVELGQNNATKVKFKWPVTEGYEPLAKNGSVFTASMTTAITELMLSIYDLELTAFLNGQEIGKAIKKDFVQVKKQNS